ncbi:MAG: hypothetical protein ABIV13_03930 [Fimbriimonadales bacterium]
MSKPLLIILVVVVLVGVFMLAKSMMNSGGEEKVEGVPEVPENLQPPVLPPNGPQPTTGGN